MSPATAVPVRAEVPDVARLLLTAGKIMLESGAGASRVEETIGRMGIACGLDEVNVFCTLTGFFVTLVSGPQIVTRLLTVKAHGIDLGRVAAVNALSREMESQAIGMKDALEALQTLLTQRPTYPPPLQMLARGLSSSAFALLMGGTWADFLPAMFAGLASDFVHSRVLRYGPEFVATYFAALVGTLGAVLATNLQLAENTRFVVIGMLMPLVPGTALTTAVRDLIAGDLLAGLSRGAEAALSAAAIAGGVYTILTWFHFYLWI